MNLKLFLYVCIIIIFLTIPFLGINYLTRVATVFLIYTISVIGLNIIIGYTGQGSLAQGAFYGLGAYITGILMLNGFTFWSSLVLAIIVTGLVSLGIGLMTLRLRGAYFAIGTLVFNVIIYEVISKWDEVTHGPRGLIGIPPPSLEAGIASITFSDLLSFYYLTLLFLSVLFLVYRHLIRSSFGTILIAIRENEILAEYSGINLTKFKVVSFIISAVYASIAGSLISVYIGTVFPEFASYVYSFSFLTAAILGGLGTLFGPLIGTFVITLIREGLFMFAHYTTLLEGLILLFVILYMPRGIIGTYYSHRRAKGKPLPKSAILGKF